MQRVYALTFRIKLTLKLNIFELFYRYYFRFLRRDRDKSLEKLKVFSNDYYMKTIALYIYKTNGSQNVKTVKVIKSKFCNR